MILRGYMNDGTNEHGVADLIFDLHRKGTKVWLDGTHLRYLAPRGAITSEDIDRLRALKSEIVEFLQTSPSHSEASDEPLQPRLSSDRVPLRAVQRLTWNINKLDKNPSELSAFVTCLVGDLNVKALVAAFTELVRRHESLRTRIVCTEGVPWQDVYEARGPGLEISHLRGESKDQRLFEAKKFVAKRFCEPVNVSVGPLFVARLLKLDEREHVLVISWDHIFNDIVSVTLLWRDLWTMYEQVKEGRPLQLPRVSVQFADYAVWEEKTSRTWMAKHGAYWRDRFSDARVLHAFPSENVAQASGQGRRDLSIPFSEGVVTKLRQRCASERISPMLGFLTAYAASLLRWCELRDVTIHVPAVGRDYRELENTIGAIASGMLLRLKILENDSVLDFARQVVNEYVTAYDHGDFFRAQLYETTFPPFASFNWFSNEHNMKVVERLVPSLEMKPFASAEALRHEGFELGGEADPLEITTLALFEGEHEVIGHIAYLPDRVTTQTVERFAAKLREVIDVFIYTPDCPVMAI